MVPLFHYSKLFRYKKIASANSSAFVALFHINQLSSRSISSLTVSAPYNIDKNSKGSSAYIVSYLINSCGLSPESAISASKIVNFETPEKPDSVLELLKKYGFDQTQISKVVRRCPHLLFIAPERALVPKFEFFRSVSFSRADLARVLTSNPELLLRNLDNSIMPFHNLLKSVLSDDKLVLAAMKCPLWLIHPNNIIDNVRLLREMRVPQSKIVFGLTHFPDVIMQKNDQFRKTVDKVMEMGFDPLKSTFMLAIRSLSGKSSQLRWDRSFRVYKRWGWSENDIMSAFKKHPDCMYLSEEKIEKAMDFFVNKMGFEPNVVAVRPTVLLYSLEKRTIPRCLVTRVLSLKGIIKEKNLRTILLPSDKEFLERFVTQYKDQLPHLMSVYQGKVDILALETSEHK